MNRVGYWSSVVAFALSMCSGGATVAQSLDAHDLFEERCTSCHGHAGAFARENLSLKEGVVVGSNGVDLTAFLTRHMGGLSAQETQRMLDMFRAQLDSGAYFQENCVICHDRAYEFARLFLIDQNGVLWGRYSKRRVDAFLPGHARMTNEEAERMGAALSAILAGGR